MKKLMTFWRQTPSEKITTLKAKLWTLYHISGLGEIYCRLLTNLRYRLSQKKEIPKHTLPGRLVVSLTSYPPRFPSLHLTLKTLLSQDISPDLIILWLYEPDITSLPEAVKNLQNDRFKIRSTPKDLKSFKKLIPTLTAYPDSYVVTADDDVYYRNDWLRTLINGYQPGAKEILGHRAHYITTDQQNHILPYQQWRKEISQKSSDPKIFLTGNGGILYPPGALAEEALDTDTFLKLCPTADDIWFYFMARKNHFVCRKIGGTFRGYCWAGSQKVALFNTNIHDHINDHAMKNMIDHFGNPF